MFNVVRLRQALQRRLGRLGIDKDQGSSQVVTHHAGQAVKVALLVRNGALVQDDAQAEHGKKCDQANGQQVDDLELGAQSGFGE